MHFCRFHHYLSRLQISHLRTLSANSSVPNLGMGSIAGRCRGRASGLGLSDGGGGGGSGSAGRRVLARPRLLPALFAAALPGASRSRLALEVDLDRRGLELDPGLVLELMR